MKEAKKAFELCLDKLENTMCDMPSGLPEYFACGTGDYFKKYEISPHDFMDILTWQPSFFTGEALIAFEVTKDEKYLHWLESFADIYREKVFLNSERTMHDLGFLYILYSVGLYRITGKEEYKDISLKAADELAKRFRLNGGYIRAWGKPGELTDKHAGVAIIDCMMNLSLLFWASEVTGNPFYREIAVSHADMAMKYFVREDASVFHAYRFDPITGEPLEGANFCGYEKDSFWARGAAWAIYGFTNCYQHTLDERYLDTAMRICHKYIESVKSEDKNETIPVWDFCLPKDKEQTKDTSAAAIVVSSVFEILKYRDDKQIREYGEQATAELLTPKYLDQNPQIPGILKESNGLHHYTLFGDYYFMELLAKREYGIISLW